LSDAFGQSDSQASPIGIPSGPPAATISSTSVQLCVRCVAFVWSLLRLVDGEGAISDYHCCTASEQWRTSTSVWPHRQGCSASSLRAVNRGHFGSRIARSQLRRAARACATVGKAPFWPRHRRPDASDLDLLIVSGEKVLAVVGA
jgi:hypothetical protein